jgi:hypothetical protein
LEGQRAVRRRRALKLTPSSRRRHVPWGLNSARAGNIQWGTSYNDARFRLGYACPPDVEAWAVMGMHWRADAVDFYFNGQLYHTIRREEWYTVVDKNALPNAPYDANFHIVISQAVRGELEGYLKGPPPAAGADAADATAAAAEVAAAAGRLDAKLAADRRASTAASGRPQVGGLYSSAVGGRPVSAADFPQQLEVDYVRVWRA